MVRSEAAATVRVGKSGFEVSDPDFLDFDDFEGDGVGVRKSVSRVDNRTLIYDTESVLKTLARRGRQAEGLDIYE